MNLIKIIKIKFFYLINKSIIAVFFLILLIINVSLLIEANNAINSSSYLESLESYNNNSFLTLKIIMTFFSVYLFTYSISNKNDFLIYLLMPIGVSKTKSFLSTIILNISIILFIFISLFISYNFIGVIYIPVYSFDIHNLETFIYILLIVLIYGIYSLILMLIIKNNFTMIIVLAIFIVSNNYYEEINSDIGLKELIMFYLLPNINSYGESYFSLFFLIFHLLNLIILSLFIYNKKDLNY